MIIDPQRYEAAKQLGYTDKEIAYAEGIGAILQYWNEKLAHDSSILNDWPPKTIDKRILSFYRDYSEKVLALIGKKNVQYMKENGTVFDKVKSLQEERTKKRGIKV